MISRQADRTYTMIGREWLLQDFYHDKLPGKYFFLHHCLVKWQTGEIIKYHKKVLPHILNNFFGSNLQNKF